MTDSVVRKKGGLGRGLASLIPTNIIEDTVGMQQLNNDMKMDVAADVVIGGKNTSKHSDFGASYKEIAITDIDPNPRQPRQSFDEQSLDELIHSIREFGLMQPIVVRALPVSATAISGTHYQLVMGERRWRAAKKAGLTHIPAIVRETEDNHLLRDALLENIHRVQLNPLEEASAYQQLLEDFCVTHDELAVTLGRSRPVITNTIRLLKLPIAVQRRVAAGVLSAGHARALLSLEGNPEKQEELATRIISEGLSVRATEEAVSLLGKNNETRNPRQRQKVLQPPVLQQTAEQLSDFFDTHVTVTTGKKKGKILIEFSSIEDLQRIIKLMDTAQSDSS